MVVADWVGQMQCGRGEEEEGEEEEKNKTLQVVERRLL
jgi:hypothetical protein